MGWFKKKTVEVEEEFLPDPQKQYQDMIKAVKDLGDHVDEILAGREEFEKTLVDFEPLDGCPKCGENKFNLEFDFTEYYKVVTVPGFGFAETIAEMVHKNHPKFQTTLARGPIGSDPAVRMYYSESYEVIVTTCETCGFRLLRRPKDANVKSV